MRFLNISLTLVLTVAAMLSTSCVTTRPSRNGVFNENQYVRKDFLVHTDANGNDNGWFLKATITKASTPNPLANMDFFTGAEAGYGSWVRFNTTSDSLQMINLREISAGNPDQQTRTPEVVNAWPATNVDLKYQVNLDGERTNFFQENQELDWKVRQWVKINWDKSDGSDFAPFGSYFTGLLAQCTDTAHTTSTLVPDSFQIEQNEPDNQDYITFKLSVSVPLTTSDACVEAFSQPTGAGNAWDAFNKLGRNSVTFELKYSLVRAAPLDPSYTPLVIEEKDRIRRKYGTIDYQTIDRDQQSGLLGAKALSMRFNPNKPIVYYFAPGYPAEYKHFFTDPKGIVAQTNEIFVKAGAAARLSVKNFDEDLADGQKPREFGDIRYNFIRWEDDIDTDSPFIGVTQFVPDPRTGEIISDSINIADFQFNDRVVAKLDFYLQSIGATSMVDANGEWTDPSGTCQDGDVIPLVPEVVAANHNGNSSLYRKMQEYLSKPTAQYGNLGPQDFIFPHTNPDGTDDTEFYNIYYKLLPYEVFGDPDTNQYVIPEGGAGTRGVTADKYMAALGKEAEFHQVTAQLDHGIVPYDAAGQSGYNNAVAFMRNLQGLQRSHRELGLMQNFNHGSGMYDAESMLSYINGFRRSARHCINGHWETKHEYAQAMVDSYHALTVWHEFGHALGLDHNFMASVDKPNFPHYTDGAGRDHIGMLQSSVMEYNAAPDRTFWKSDTGGYGWGPYDRGALGFIYANTKSDGAPPSSTVSGQISATSPWKDPYGFTTGGTETQYLFCNANHLKYSPLCRQFDMGTTPSEIIANQIDDYEWNYKWRNFRLYRKLWDESNYADAPSSMINDMRRFISMWTYDWQSGEVVDSMRRLGINPPASAIAADWYTQATFKFEGDLSAANQMVAAFHKAVIQQSSGERPYVTSYDPYFGDVTQQGIILDKLFALQSWTALWPVEDFDINQSSGAYLASYSSEFGDATYETVTEDTVESMIGGQYDIFPFGKPLAVSLFAEATHDVNFGGRTEMRDWTGGFVFYRLEDFLAYFRNLATTYNTEGCTDVLAACTYDPRVPQLNSSDVGHSDDYNEFVGPDHRRYIWVYYADRNAWIVADRDRNTATYVVMRAYTADVIHGEADGTGQDGLAPYSDLLPIKYFLDSYQQFN